MFYSTTLLCYRRLLRPTYGAAVPAGTSTSVPQYRSVVPTVPCTSWYKLVAPADTYGTAVELLIVTYRNLCLLYGSRDTSDLIIIYDHHPSHWHDCQCPVR